MIRDFENNLLNGLFENASSINEIEESINTFFNISLDSINSFQSDIIWNKVKDNYYSFNAIASVLEIAKDEHSLKIYYFGFLKAILELVKNHSTQISEIENNKKLLNSYTYLGVLIQFLSHKKSATHKEICENIGLNPSAFSNFVRKIDKFDFFRTKKTGRYKLYFITKKGTDFYRTVFREVENSNVNITITFDLLNLLINEIDSETFNFNNIIQKWDTYSNLSKCEKIQIQESINKVFHLCKKKSEHYVDKLVCTDRVKEEMITLYYRENRDYEHWFSYKAHYSIKDLNQLYIEEQGERENELGYFPERSEYFR